MTKYFPYLFLLISGCFLQPKSEQNISFLEINIEKPCHSKVQNCWQLWPQNNESWKSNQAEIYSWRTDSLNWLLIKHSKWLEQSAIWKLATFLQADVLIWNEKGELKNQKVLRTWTKAPFEFEVNANTTFSIQEKRWVFTSQTPLSQSFKTPKKSPP